MDNQVLVREQYGTASLRDRINKAHPSGGRAREPMDSLSPLQTTIE